MNQNPDQPDNLAESFQLLRRGLLAYFNHKVSNQAIAEDLLQDVFLKAITANQNNTLPKNVRSWIYTIANNTLIDFYRSKKPAMAIPENQATDDSSDELVRQELSACLLPLTRQLPDIYRDTLIATDIEGRTMKTVAKELKLSESAIKSRASRARQLLKLKLLECCHIELATNNSVTDYQIQTTAGSEHCHCDD